MLNIQEIKARYDTTKFSKDWDDVDSDLVWNDIPALIAEVERLAKENQGLRANSMIQEHIIKSGENPIDKDKIIHLILDKSEKDQQIATLKKALKLTDSELPPHYLTDESGHKYGKVKGSEYFIQQAQGQCSGK